MLDVLARIMIFLPIAFITYQVLMLRRVLRSTSWRLLALGFLVFAILTGLQIITSLFLGVRLAISLVGYTFIAAGFHLLRRDLNRVLRVLDRRPLI